MMSIVPAMRCRIIIWTGATTRQSKNIRWIWTAREQWIFGGCEQHGKALDEVFVDIQSSSDRKPVTVSFADLDSRNKTSCEEDTTLRCTKIPESGASRPCKHGISNDFWNTESASGDPRMWRVGSSSSL